MADNEPILIGGVSTTVQAEYTVNDLAPNNYLTIVWHNSKGEQFNSLDIDDEKAIQYFCDLNNALESALNSNKTSYIGQNKYVNLESIAKYLAQNIFKTSPQRTVVNALIGLISGSTKGLDDSTINLIINMFGGIVEKVARKFGFSDPHEIFASFMSENTVTVLKELGDKTQDFIDNVKAKFTGKKSTKIESPIDDKKNVKYIGLLLGLTTSDTETYDIIIPRKKVESGTDYTTHLLPQKFKKDFTVKLTNKLITSDFSRIKEIEQIEKVKDKLIEIAQSRILFDIYIRLSKDKMYKRSNVYFSSISFTKDENSGDGYECSFSVEPIEEFKTKTFISNRKYFPTASKTTNTNGSGGKINTSGYTKGYGSSSSGSTSRKNSPTSSKGNNLNLGYKDGSGYGALVGKGFKNEQDVLTVVYQGNLFNNTKYLTLEYIQGTYSGSDLKNVAIDQKEFVSISYKNKYLFVPKFMTTQTYKPGAEVGVHKITTLNTKEWTYNSSNNTFVSTKGPVVKIHDTRGGTN